MSIVVRDAHQDVVVTAIELLSPFNKREPGLAIYRAKRARYYDAAIALVEIDLLRRGSRPLPPSTRLPTSDYLVALTRAQSAEIEVWPFGIQDMTPVVPVPLQPPDADIELDVGSALSEVYDEAQYGKSIDYAQPPPPPAFDASGLAWIRDQVERARTVTEGR